MSDEQMAELALELSDKVGDERMLLEYEIRFWKQKAWRAQQQRDRAEVARKEAENITEKYKAIPQEVLDKVIVDLKEKELNEVKDAALVHMQTIGITNFRRLTSKAELLDTVESKIKHWKEVVSNHRSYVTTDDD